MPQINYYGYYITLMDPIMAFKFYISLLFCSCSIVNSELNTFIIQKLPYNPDHGFNQPRLLPSQTKTVFGQNKVHEIVCRLKLLL